MTSPDHELLELISKYQYYPEKLASILWRWDEGELAGIEAPDTWQLRELRELGEDMRAAGFNGVDAVRKILRAVGSGRGIGKSADVGMTVTILLAAFPDAKITVMANSGDQLATKTWPEIRKWLRRSIVHDWFEANSSIIYRLGARDSWFAVPITWNMENPQASAGQQNIGSVNVVIFDEASEIPDKIAEVSLAGLSTGLPIGLARGNPTRSTGFFADALQGRYAFGNWKAKTIDSRTCRFPNKDEIQDDIEHYGLDSDYVRVWRLGLPPKSSLDQYFPEALIQRAIEARPVGLRSDPLIASCDLAWGGSDPNCIRFAHGLDAWSLEPIKIPGEQTEDPEVMVAYLAQILAKEWRPAGRQDGVKITHMFMDAAGSANVIQRRLRELGFDNLTLVNFGGHSLNMKQDRNVRAQMIRGVKEYMESGAGIGISKELAADLRNIQKVKSMPLQFEDKDLIRKRLKRSTDELDALALTRYAPVAPLQTELERQREQQMLYPQRRTFVGDTSHPGSFMR
jgi:hypothetical protein